MSHWKKGGTPNAATLKKFADYFDVSTDDLINGAKIPNTHKYEDEQLLAAYEQADDNIKAAIRQLLKL